ncbi:SlyX family protein [Rhodobacteraceae bacterium]|nr:SlyX family protein [Paracoccaceae bacterium]NBQ28703.1 SlyX family protein [Paracoccaceae bacterium]
MEKCETALAHLTKSNDELSDIVATQQTQIAVLQRRVDMLLSREAEREAQGTEYVADQRPPHW